MIKSENPEKLKNEEINPFSGYPRNPFTKGPFVPSWSAKEKDDFKEALMTYGKDC